MDDILNWLWQGTAVAAAAFIACRLLDRAPAQARYVLCGAALTAVLALPLLGFLLARGKLPGPTREPLALEPALAIPDVWWTSAGTITVLWAIWFGVSAVRAAAAAIALGRTKRALGPVPADIESRLRLWRALRNAGRRTSLAMSTHVRSAAVLGCGAPVIALAPSLLERLRPDDLDRIVAHEWGHVQRRDDLVHAFQILIRAVAGWHPAVWWLDRQLSLEREIACDELAVALSGNPKTYASCLTTVAMLAPRSAGRAPALGVLSRPALSRRIVRILTNRPAASPARVTCAVGASALTVIVLAIGTATLQPIAIAASLPEVSRIGDVALRFEIAPSAPQPAGVSRQRPSARRDAGDRGQSNPAPVQPSAHGSPPSPAATPMAEPQPVPHAGAELTPGALPMLTTTTAERLLDIAAPAPPQAAPDAATPQPTAGDRPQTPWGAAADAGVAVGRGSQKAGVATASFFSRFGKQIAGSF